MIQVTNPSVMEQILVPFWPSNWVAGWQFCDLLLFFVRRYNPKNDFPAALGDGDEDLDLLPPQAGSHHFRPLPKMIGELWYFTTTIVWTIVGKRVLLLWAGISALGFARGRCWTHGIVQQLLPVFFVVFFKQQDELSGLLLWRALHSCKRLSAHDANAAMVWSGSCLRLGDSNMLNYIPNTSQHFISLARSSTLQMWKIIIRPGLFFILFFGTPRDSSPNGCSPPSWHPFLESMNLWTYVTLNYVNWIKWITTQTNGESSMSW